MYDEQSNDTRKPLGLILALGTYISCIFGFLLTMAIGFPFIIKLVSYFIFGIILNRIVLRKLEFHHMHNTIGEIAEVKLTALFLWPIYYVILIFFLMINRFL